jgi:hypothetical protein
MELIKQFSFIKYNPKNSEEKLDKENILILLNQLFSEIECNYNFELIDLDIISNEHDKIGCVVVLKTNSHFFYIDIFNFSNVSVCKAIIGGDIDDDAIIDTDINNAIEFFRYYNNFNS